MTADRASSAADDLELLADYTAGLLDGSPEGAALAERLEREPELARLHGALVSADPIVRAELRALPALTMPADVSADLAALFAAEPPLAATPLLDPPEREATVVPLRPRRGWVEKAGAVAAGVALLGGLAVSAKFLLPVASPTSSNDSSTAAAGPAHESQRAYADTATGTNYTAAALPSQVSGLVKRSKRSELASGEKAPAPSSWSSSLLDDCMSALGFAGRVLALDYAAYEGSPALVVVASSAAAGQADVAVVGPDCGRTGTDERLRTSVPLSR